MFYNYVIFLNIKVFWEFKTYFDNWLACFKFVLVSFCWIKIRLGKDLFKKKEKKDKEKKRKNKSLNINLKREKLKIKSI